MLVFATILFLGLLAAMAGAFVLENQRNDARREARQLAADLAREQVARKSTYGCYTAERDRRAALEAQLKAERERHAEEIKVVKAAAAKAANDAANAKLKRLYAGLLDLVNEGTP